MIQGSSKETTASVVPGTPEKTNAASDRAEVNRKSDGVPAKVSGREEKLFRRETRKGTVEGKSSEPKLTRPNRKEQTPMKAITMKTLINREDKKGRAQGPAPLLTDQETWRSAGVVGGSA